MTQAARRAVNRAAYYARSAEKAVADFGETVKTLGPSVNYQGPKQEDLEVIVSILQAGRRELEQLARTHRRHHSIWRTTS